MKISKLFQTIQKNLHTAQIFDQVKKLANIANPEEIDYLHFINIDSFTLETPEGHRLKVKKDSIGIPGSQKFPIYHATYTSATHTSASLHYKKDIEFFERQARDLFYSVYRA